MPTALAIIAALWDLATPLEGAAGPEGCHYRRLDYPTTALARLAEQYLEEDLIQAGVAVRDVQEQLTMAPTLAVAGAPIYAVRATADSPPIDLITDRGTILGRPPGMAMLADYSLRELLEAGEGYLFLVRTLAQAARWNAAGMPALTYPGVEGLTIPWLQTLTNELRRPNSAADDLLLAGEDTAENGQALDGTEAIAGAQQVCSPSWDASPSSPPSEAAADLSSCCSDHFGQQPKSQSATLAACPSAGEPRPADERLLIEPALPLLVITSWPPDREVSEQSLERLMESIKPLIRARYLLGKEFPATCVWLPTAADVEDLCLIEQHGTTGTLREALLDRLEQSARTFDALGEDQREPDYLDARRQYHDALRRAAEGKDVDLTAARQAYGRAGHRALVEPLLARAIECADPIERMKYSLLAELSAILQEQAPLVGRELQAARDGPALAERLTQFLGVARQFYAAAKMIH